MKTAAFIPIKKHSERVNKKNFSELCGRKLYEHIILNALSADCFDDIYVDTDSQEIKSFCARNKVKVIDRKPKLASNNANGNDLLNYHAKKFPKYDLYFQLFATAPFLKPSTISDCVNKLKNTNKYDSILTVTEQQGWYWVNGSPVNYRPGILPRSQDSQPILKETTGLYGVFKKSLKKYNCRIGSNPIFYQVEAFEAIDLDTIKDFDLAKTLCSKCESEIPSPYIYDDE